MRGVWTGATLAIALGCAVTLAGQATSQHQPSSSAAQQTITVSGCLQKGDSTESATGTSGTSSSGASARVSARRWMLVNATESTAGSSATSPSSSSSSSHPTGTSGASYVLEGKTDELAAHAGHKVEITGAPAPASASSSSPSSSSGALASSSSSASSAQRLQVTSVKMVAATCQ